MRIYRLGLMSSLLLLFVTPAVMAQTTPADTKPANIRKLLVLMDTGNTFKNAMQTQVDLMKVAAKDIPPRFWDELMKEIDSAAFLELLVPIYDKHFSAQELDALIAFYETPTGKKLVSVLPQIIVDSGVVSERYGKEVSERVIQRMQAEGTFPGSPPAGGAKPSPSPRP